jgi:3-deoxy-D-manno-octulosonic-acid transferase
MMLKLYRGLTTALAPAVSAYLEGRRRRGKEDPDRFPERQGLAGHQRPSGPLIWIHGASVGEAISVLPLVEKLSSRCHVLVTTGTVTSAKLMAERLPKGALHQYVPVDRLPWVRRFLDHWKPDLALWLESELWPNLVVETAVRNIPMVLVNGRVSDRSYAQWRRFPALARSLLSPFSLCLGQTNEDAERLKSLGAPHVACVGNLKFAAPPLPVDPKELAEQERSHLFRPVWLAASTHAGEEALAGRVHLMLKPRRPDLLTVIVPRHPDRAPAIADELRDMGLSVVRRSLMETPLPGTDIHLVDTMGEMGLFYRLARVVLIGKSLTGAGGQNPLEPARLGCAVLMGPRMDNFRDIARRMKVKGAAIEVADETALASVVNDLLEHEIMRRGLADAALAFAAAEAGVINRVMNALAPFLEKLDARP